MEKKGISLVALVITIIVLIILTGAVIATFMEGGIIDRAKQAVMKSDCATLQEVYNLKYNTAKIEVATGNGGEIDKLEVLKETVDEIGIKGFNFNNPYLYEGDNKEILSWVLATFIYPELGEAGYMFSIIDGVPYMTGLDCLVGYRQVVQTKVEDILKILKNDEYIIVDKDGNKLENEDKVSTGFIIKKGTEDYLTIVVKGDTDGSGIMTLGDLTPISSFFTNGDESSLTMAQKLACDVNNDGIVSLDDFNFVAMNFGAKDLQIVNMYKIPEIQKGYLYKWHTNESIIKELSNVYTIEEDYYITIPAGMKYSVLEEEIGRIIGVPTFSLNVADKDAVIQNGDYVESNTYWKISDTEYIKNDLELEVIVQ